MELTDGDGPRSGIITFAMAGRDAVELAAASAEHGINVSVSRASHARLDLDSRGLSALVRAPPHVYNTTEELELLVEALRRGRGRGSVHLA